MHIPRRGLSSDKCSAAARDDDTVRLSTAEDANFPDDERNREDADGTETGDNTGDSAGSPCRAEADEDHGAAMLMNSDRADGRRNVDANDAEGAGVPPRPPVLPAELSEAACPTVDSRIVGDCATTVAGRSSEALSRSRPPSSSPLSSSLPSADATAEVDRPPECSSRENGEDGAEDVEDEVATEEVEEEDEDEVECTEVKAEAAGPPRSADADGCARDDITAGAEEAERGCWVTLAGLASSTISSSTLPVGDTDDGRGRADAADRWRRRAVREAIAETDTDDDCCDGSIDKAACVSFGCCRASSSGHGEVVADAGTVARGCGQHRAAQFCA